MIDLGMQIDAGMMLGTALSVNSLRTLNTKLGGQGYFEDASNRLFSGRLKFTENYVDVFKRAVSTVKNTMSSIITVNGYISVDSERKLGHIPIDMQLPILQYEPIRKLFDQGRVFGFGYESIPDDDPYGRIAIQNGSCNDVLASKDDDGFITLDYVWNEGDPNLSFEEMDHITATREYIAWLLENTDIDPTDFPNEVL